MELVTSCSWSGVGEFSHDQLEWSRLFEES